MKFIKTDNGLYIRADQLIGFQVAERTSGKFEAHAKLVTKELLVLKTFSCDPKSTTQFDPEAEAQAWLDNFVAKLNEDS